MTPTPPEGFKIIPRAYLEAGNPLPEDALFDCDGEWMESTLAGKDISRCLAVKFNFYATAQPLPCFASPDQTPEQRIAELERESRTHFYEKEDAKQSLTVALEELAQLRATIETLTRERDEARDERQKFEDNWNVTVGQLQKAREIVADYRAQLAASEKARERLSEALDKIGFFFAGSDQQHIADHVLNVLAGKTIHESIRERGAAMKEAK